jgi:hypothetical protein
MTCLLLASESSEMLPFKAFFTFCFVQFKESRTLYRWESLVRQNGACLGSTDRTVGDTLLSVKLRKILAVVTIMN